MNALHLLATLCWLVVAQLHAQAQDKAPLFRAGAATSNITPPLGIEIVGGFVPYPATHIHDELHARCIVLDDGKTKIALVVCDLLGMHRSVSIEARRLIEKSVAIPSGNVMISCTHTHSAGSALGERGYQSDQPLNEYQLFVAQRIADGVKRANNLLRPAEMAYGSIAVPEHVFNRRWRMQAGTAPVNPFGKIDLVKMNPPTASPHLIEPAGPIDPEVSYLAFRERTGRMIGIFAAYSLHYVGGVGDGHVSADYFGRFCESLQRLDATTDTDVPFVAALANGTSGDINNIDFRKARPRKLPYEQIRYVADDVARRVHASFGGLAWSSDPTLGARYRELDLAWRKVDDSLMAWIQETEAKGTDPSKPNDLSAIYAARCKRLSQASQETKAPVQVFRIGKVGIGTSPCETFAETGLEFKERDPFQHGFLVELAHGYYGYLPTPRHFELGGYETWPGTNYLEPQASSKILSALLEMSQELVADGPSR
jgi:hypothetical protein